MEVAGPSGLRWVWGNGRGPHKKLKEKKGARRLPIHLNFPGVRVVKNPAENAIDVGRSPREGNDNPLQYSCLGNPLDRGAWRTIVYGFAGESYTT